MPKKIEVLEKTETVNPLLSPNAEFDYIDVSSVSNTTFQIEETQRLKGKDAPSRARKLVRTNDIIFATIRPTLQRIAVVPEHFDKQVCSTGYFVLRPKPGMDHRFVYYSLFTEDFTGQMESLQKGASYPAVTDGDVRAQEIPVPPLAEQQRIVVLLDEAFEGLATAKANAEKNLQNARALFESHLQSVFTQRGPGWVTKTFGEVLEIRNGRNQLEVESPDGEFPIYGSAGKVMGMATDYICEAGTTIIGRKGNINSPIYADTRFWNVDTAFGLASKAGMDSRFLYFFCLSYDFSAHNRGTTIPSLVKSELLNIPIPVPPPAEQQRIVGLLDSLQEETQRLARFYERKHAALEALKKSLLHQAFTGAL